MRLSPLCYSPQYFVTSNHEGVRSKYIVYLDGLKIRLNKLSSNQTDEPSGLRVEVPLKQDYKERPEWVNAIKRQCAYFEVKSNVVNDWIIDSNEYAKFSTLFNSNTLHFCLGKVYYPIDFERLGMDTIDIPLAVQIGLDEGIYCTPSREALVYTDSTIEILKGKISTMLADFVHHHKKSVQEKEGLQLVQALNSGFYNVPYVASISISRYKLEPLYKLAGVEPHTLPVDISPSDAYTMVSNRSLTQVLKVGRRISKEYITYDNLPKGFKTWFKNRQGVIYRPREFQWDKISEFYFSNKPVPQDVKDFMNKVRLEYYATYEDIKENLLPKFNDKPKDSKERGTVFYARHPRSASVNPYVVDKANFVWSEVEKEYKYLFLVNNNNTSLKKWFKFLACRGLVLIHNNTIMNQIPDNILYKTLNIEDYEASAVLRRLATEALVFDFIQRFNLKDFGLARQVVGRVNTQCYDLLGELENYKEMKGFTTDIVESLLEAGTALNCFNQAVKAKVDFLSQFEGIKYAHLFIEKENRYEPPSVKKDLTEFKRVWKLELMYKKGLIKDYELLVNTEAVDSAARGVNLLETVE